MGTASSLALLLAGRTRRASLPSEEARTPTRRQAFLRCAHRSQVQRPALAPVVVTLVALAGQFLVRASGPGRSIVGDEGLAASADAFGLSVLTDSTLLAGMVAGFGMPTAAVDEPVGPWWDAGSLAEQEVRHNV